MTHWNENNADMSLVNRLDSFDTRVMASNTKQMTPANDTRHTTWPDPIESDTCGVAKDGCVQCELDRIDDPASAPKPSPPARVSPQRRLVKLLRRVARHRGSAPSASRLVLERLDPQIRDPRG